MDNASRNALIFRADLRQRPIRPRPVFVREPFDRIRDHHRMLTTHGAAVHGILGVRQRRQLMHAPGAAFRVRLVEVQRGPQQNRQILASVPGVQPSFLGLPSGIDLHRHHQVPDPFQLFQEGDTSIIAASLTVSNPLPRRESQAAPNRRPIPRWYRRKLEVQPYPSWKSD
nr:hypothetical protein [Allokutzneria albata]